MVVISDHYCIVMDTDVNNDIYAINDSGMYILFQQTKRNIYCIYNGETDDTEH